MLIRCNSKYCFLIKRFEFDKGHRVLSCMQIIQLVVIIEKIFEL